MGGINFGWLAFWLLSPDWLSRKLEICDFCLALGWSPRAWGSWVRAVSRLCIIYPGICLTTETESRKNLSQGNRKALGWSGPDTIRLVDWPAGPSRPWLSRQATGSPLRTKRRHFYLKAQFVPRSKHFSSRL